MRNFMINIWGEGDEGEFIGEVDVRAPDLRRATMLAEMMFRGLDSEQIIVDEVCSDE